MTARERRVQGRGREGGRSAAIVLSALALSGAARAAEPPAIDPANAVWTLSVEGLPAGQPLALRMVTALGAVQTAEATRPAGLKVSADGAVDGKALSAVVTGAAKRDALFFALGVEGARVAGTCTGMWNQASATGMVVGTAAPGRTWLEGSPAPPLEWLKASCFGTPTNDNFEGVAVGPDGCLYLVGNAGMAVRELPGGAAPVSIGSDVADPLCGCGFVLKLSPDASNVLAFVQFAKGLLHATAVAVTSNGVYVGGYASDGLEPLLKDRAGLRTDYPLRTEQRLIREGRMVEANGIKAGSPDPMSGRPWLGRLGAPCVLRLTADLRTLQNGTYLEGWQQVYDKKRICGRLKGYFPEFFWQPINVCPLPSGDVAVAHDGGYFRMLTDADREAAAKQATPEAQAELLRRLCFYDTADYVSRLSGDLTRRFWKTDIRTPPTDPAVAEKIKGGWRWPHFGNPRTHRMRVDPHTNLWVAGWSASATSQEPWWSPFLWRLDPTNGAPTAKLYEYDPMGGGGNRMGGTVADTALLTVAVEEDGNLLTALVSDGGNCVMGWGPRGNEGKRMTGPVTGPGLGGSPAHFWGQVHRVDGKTLDGLGGARSGPWAWTIDAAGLPAGHFLALGRWNAPLPWTPNAWWRNGVRRNPNAFLRVVAPDYATVFWTAIPGVRPFEVMPIGGGRYMLVGFSDGSAAPLKDSLVTAPPGGADAYFAIVRWNPAPRPADGR